MSAGRSILQSSLMSKMFIHFRRRSIITREIRRMTRPDATADLPPVPGLADRIDLARNGVSGRKARVGQFRSDNRDRTGLRLAPKNHLDNRHVVAQTGPICGASRIERWRPRTVQSPASPASSQFRGINKTEPATVDRQIIWPQTMDSALPACRFQAAAGHSASWSTRILNLTSRATPPEYGHSSSDRQEVERSAPEPLKMSRENGRCCA